MSKNHNIFKNTFKDIICFDNLKSAYNRTQKSKSKYKKSSIKFSMNLTKNLKTLESKLKTKEYTTDKYKTFKVHEPKERIISAPQFKDKVVQFAAHNILNPDFERKFIYDSYSCIKGKGTHACADRAQHFLSKANWKWRNPWILKADIKNYFYSIDHDILKELLGKEIKDKDTMWLLEEIINGSPNPIGLPLGNITSQLFANVYLNELDKYMKRVLGKKFYLRYMDDICCIVKSRANSKKLKKLITSFVNEKLNLRMNKNKTKIFPLKQGVNFTGYKIWHTHKLLRKKSKERIKSKLKKFPKLIRRGDLTKQKAEQMLNSWKGHADHACSYNLYLYLENRFDFLIFEDDKLKIDISKIKEG